jgi:dTDP-4-dehydrorhamnose reductase
MRMLVVGATGLVGRAVLRAWADRGAAGTYCHHAEPGLLALDLRKPETITHAMDVLRPEVVVLSGALADPDRCEAEPSESIAINVTGTAHVVESCRVQGARIAFLSTDYVFDGTAGPYGEDDETAPINAYGAHKREAERLVLAMSGALVVRTCGVFGPRAHGPDPVRALLRAARAGEPIHASDEHRTSPTWVEDLAAEIGRLVESRTAGIVHVAGPEVCSRREFAQAVLAAASLDANVVQPSRSHGAGAPRPQRCGLRIDKARALGYAPLAFRDALPVVTRHVAE